MVRNQPRLWLGTPPGWLWPQGFIHELVSRAMALAGMPGLAEVYWAELAPDYEAFEGRALPASPDPDCGVHACSLGSEPKSRARQRPWRSAT